MADAAPFPERTNHTWTPRQREVLDRIACGKTNPEIAAELGISLAGVKWHVSEVLSILGVDSREEAAIYWRRWNAPLARGRRWLAALACAGTVKATAGAAGVAAVAGAGLMVAGTWRDSAAVGHEPMASVANTSVTPQTPISSADMVTITSIPLDGGGEARLLGARTAGGLCLALEHSQFVGTQWCPQEAAFQGGWGYSRPSVMHGATAKVADHVEVSLHDGTSLVVPLAVAPPELGTDAKFYLFAVPRPELVGTVRAVDGAGNVLESFTLFDPPGTPSRREPPPPLEEIDARWSGRADPATGSVPFRGGRRGATVAAEGGTYRFRVEHDGAEWPRIMLWCQTGIMPLVYEDGPDSVGNGTIVARIPRDSAACFFRTEGFGGNLRIVGLAAESEVGVSPQGWKGGP
jgi:DNA-binding CsgD family transcriptional regulator